MKKVTFKNLIRENTGSNFLDSGSTYGYKYQKPIPKKAITLDGDCARNSISGTISLLHFLESNLTIDQEATANLRGAIDRDECDDVYSGYAAYFVKRGYKLDDSDNTCNHDTDLDQEFQFSILTAVDDSQIIIIESHNGCDVRGGYSAPVVCDLPDYCEFFSGMDLGVSFTSVDGDSDRNNTQAEDEEFQQGYDSSQVYRFSEQIDKLLHWNQTKNEFTAILKDGRLVEGYLSNQYVN